MPAIVRTSNSQRNQHFLHVSLWLSCISLISFLFKPELKCLLFQPPTLLLSPAPPLLSQLPAGVATVPIVAVDLSHQ